ncbi:Lethal(2) giant larvae protein-like protein 1-like [Oopsacas minuta]|uniref:Lethal(2) giant larvae protein-like protein 1-like n=1 Tax=Oopsacas minuta TaxID=111878 RepID=A0AAV7KBI3_9METZ|nr:Lethal(2) giant larvae protein-like protein 1-like [Oopsacas minuta]
MFKKLKQALASSGSASLLASNQFDELQSKFLLHKTTFHGFPPNPTCFTHDSIWSLLFIGTSTGQIYMYGTPGLEIKTEHPDYPINFSSIQYLFPLSEHMQLVSICENNTLHVWSICDEDNNAQLIVLNQKELIQGRGKEITACCIRRHCVYFGTGDGRLYEVELQFMGITLIDWEEGESTPIVSLEICPTDRNFMLCGYKNGLVALRNVKQGISVYSVQRKQIKETWGACSLTGVTWQHTGDGFLACYSNGEIAYWTVSNRGTPDYVNTFFESEFNLEAITKPIWTSSDILVFGGGIPEDLATNPTITLARAREPEKLELTSPIASPVPYCSSPIAEDNDNPVILREQDIHKLQEPIPSVVEAIRSSSPYSTTSTLERNHGHSRRSGFYPDCGDITLEKLKSLAINQEFDDAEFPTEDLIGHNMEHVLPSPIKEVETPEHTPNGPETAEESFMTAKSESFDLSTLELGKISREMEVILAELNTGGDKSTPSVTRNIRTSGEASNYSEQEITETLLQVGDFTRDEEKYIKVNGDLLDDVTDNHEVVLREKHVQINDSMESNEDINENGDDGIEGLDLFEKDRFAWRESTIHEEATRNASSPHESDLDEVIDSIERLVSRPWVKKMNPWKNEDRQMIKFTSTIKGFFVIQQDEYTARWMRSSSPTPSVRSEILVALLDQEILFIDITKPDYPLVMPPYLTNIHSSPVTCSLLLDNLASVEYKLLKQLGAAQINQLYAATNVEWPFTGGEVKEEFSRELTVIFITGHENGTVKFWDITGGSLSLIYCLYTNYLFDLGVNRSTPGVLTENRLEGIQRGFWDPYAEDCRLKVTSLCCYDAVLAVGGAGGQVILFELTHELVTPSVFQLDGVLLEEDIRIRHRPGLQPLHFKSPHDPDRGYVPIFFFQMSPASPITALEMAHKFSLVAVGCSYGLAVIDVEKRSIVFTHTTFEEGK